MDVIESNLMIGLVISGHFPLQEGSVGASKQNTAAQCAVILLKSNYSGIRVKGNGLLVTFDSFNGLMKRSHYEA